MALPALQLKVALEELKVDPGGGLSITPGAEGSFLFFAFCSIISMTASRYWWRYFFGSQSALMPSIKACAILSSSSFSAVVGRFNSSGLSTSLAKCISSRMRNSPSGFTAARYSRLLMTTLAMPIFPVPLSALWKSAYAFSPPFPGSRKYGL